jgi:hypothetical protein
VTDEPVLETARGSSIAPPSTAARLLRREFHVIVTIMDADNVFFVRRVDRADDETYRLRDAALNRNCGGAATADDRTCHSRNVAETEVDVP